MCDLQLLINLLKQKFQDQLFFFEKFVFFKSQEANENFVTKFEYIPKNSDRELWSLCVNHTVQAAKQQRETSDYIAVFSEKKNPKKNFFLCVFQCVGWFVVYSGL